ncbi:hypothetical protein D3C84_594990 [compost metagenome]
MDAVLKELWRHELIALGQRLQGIGVEHVVEFVDWTVDAFPRVVFRRCLGNERNQQRAGTHTKLSELIAPAHIKTPWIVPLPGAEPGAKTASIRRKGRFRQHAPKG